MAIANVSVVVDVGVPLDEFVIEQATEDGGIAIVCRSGAVKVGTHTSLVWSDQFVSGGAPTLEIVLQECAKHIHDFPEVHS